MKEKGFTLVELLAVIVILAVIALITIVSVNNTLTDTKDSLSETQIKKVEEASKSYYLQEGMNIEDKCVNISELIEKGYIEGKTIIDPKTKEELKGSVKITYESNQYSYKYQEDICSVCTLIDNDGDKKASLSDMITCGSESFYVMSNDGKEITMLAQYNLDVGNYHTSAAPDSLAPIPNPTGIQNEKAKGFLYSESGSPDRLNIYGTVVFSTTYYWESGSYKPAGDSSYEYIYDANSLIYPYVKNYEEYLKNNGVSSASATLMSYEQAESLGCDNSKHNCSTAPSWLYSTSYWLGSRVTSYGVWIVTSRGYFDGNGYGSADVFGVRPVVTISIYEIK